MSAEHADRLAALDEQRLVVLETAQGRDDRVERLPAARCSPRPAINDEIVRTLGDFGIEIVHQHAQRGFLLPALAGQRGTPRSSNDARPMCSRGLW
jgi:hypothetical protein